MVTFTRPRYPTIFILERKGLEGLQVIKNLEGQPASEKVYADMRIPKDLQGFRILTPDVLEIVLIYSLCVPIPVVAHHSTLALVRFIPSSKLPDSNAMSKIKFNEGNIRTHQQRITHTNISLRTCSSE